MKYACFVIVLTLVTACEMFEYNVYQTKSKNHVIEVTTEYNVNRLLSLPKKDTIRLALFGDTQRYYDDLKDLVQVINNQPMIDAVIITGDLADFALYREYDWLNRELIKLKVPFLTVIGNHDCLANGTTLYRTIYGPLNYSFTWNDIRFVMHNTNSREFNFNGSITDIDWMRNQLIDSAAYNACIFISHIPPHDEDFDPLLKDEYTALLRNAKNTIFSSNGHRHHYAVSQPFEDGIWYLNTGSPVNRIYSYVTIYPNVDSDKMFDCVPVHF